SARAELPVLRPRDRRRRPVSRGRRGREARAHLRDPGARHDAGDHAREAVRRPPGTADDPALLPGPTLDAARPEARPRPGAGRRAVLLRLRPGRPDRAAPESELRRSPPTERRADRDHRRRADARSRLPPEPGPARLPPERLRRAEDPSRTAGRALP